MTEQTRTLPTQLEHLDFEPGCSVKGCDQAAKFLAIKKCCGESALECAPHKEAIVQWIWDTIREGGEPGCQSCQKRIYVASDIRWVAI